ncbi:MAG: DUF1385 domain-containing protein [Clostridia bacterium]|nr:DUF1385 domain-containing protein [Clostridia bacterium]
MAKNEKNCRLGKVGGQAVIEGVMMKGPKRYCTAVRKESGEIVRDIHPNRSLKDKYKILGIHVVRGVVNFVETMILSFSTLNFAADAMGIEDEETAFDRWLNKHLGKKATAVFTGIGAVLGVVLAIALFMWLPKLISDWLVGDVEYVRNVVEGFIKIAIFLVYIILVSLTPYIKRVFMYHGAEHKSIFCYENSLELTVENVRKQKRLHPRCGTSFMFLMMFVGIVIGLFLPRDNTALYVALKLLTLPIVVGLGYEIIRFAGKHDNLFIRIITAPGKWMQLITTKEPDDSMMEVAIVALKTALESEFPEEDVFKGIAQPEPDETAENGNNSEESKEDPAGEKNENGDPEEPVQ